MNMRFAQAAVLVASMLAALTAWAAPTVTMWKSGEKEYFHPGTNYINQNVDVVYSATAGSGGTGLTCTTKNTSGYGASLTGVKRLDTFTSSTAQTKTYEVTCTDSTGSTTKTQSVTWSALPAAPTVSATVTPTTYYFDEETTYAWTVSNAYSCDFKSMHRNDDDTGWVRHSTETFFPSTDSHLSGEGIIADKSWFMPNGDNKYRYKLECTNAAGTTTVNKDVTYAVSTGTPSVKLEQSDSDFSYISSDATGNVGLTLTVSGADSCWTSPGDFMSDINAKRYLPTSGVSWVRTPPDPAFSGWKNYTVVCKNNTSGKTASAMAAIFWRPTSGMFGLLDNDRDTGGMGLKFAPRLYGVGLMTRDLVGGLFGGYGGSTQFSSPSDLFGKACSSGQALLADGTCAQRVARTGTAEITFRLIGIPSGTVCTRSSDHPVTSGTWANTSYTVPANARTASFSVADNVPANADTAAFVPGTGGVYTSHNYTMTCGSSSKTIPVVFN